MTHSARKTRIAVVDSHAMVAECLCLTLDLRGHEAIQVPLPTSSNSSAAILLAAILGKRPDMVVLDPNVGTDWHWTNLVQSLARSGATVVVLTQTFDPARWGEALAHGARLALPKDGPVRALNTAIRRLNDRVPLLTFEQRQRLLQAYHHENRDHHEHRARLDRLTKRESEVLSHLMAGHTVIDIARTGAVAEATVRTQIKAVLAKLEVSSQIAAVGLAHHTGWLPRDVVTTTDRFKARKLSTAAAG